MDREKIYLFKQALSEAVENQFDKAVAGCDEPKLNADAINYFAIKLDRLIDDAARLYLSGEDISNELANALGLMWEKCSDFIEMYENVSRE